MSQVNKENFSMRSVEGAETAVIAFGGFNEALAWKNRLDNLGVSYIHFQDSRRRWYLDGADGFDSFQSFLSFVEEYSRQYSRRVLFLGQSFGGYAALRVGCSLGFGRVLAFAPQTHSPSPRQMYPDQRLMAVPSDIVDIRGIVAGSRTQCAIYVSRVEENNPPSGYFWDDHAHLIGLSGLARVNIQTMPTTLHPVAWELSRMGLLNKVIADEFALV